MASGLNRFTNIFWHYFSGPLAGFNQRLWPEERTCSPFMKCLAAALYLIPLVVIVMPVQPWLRLGAAFIMFSPQWLYAFTSLPHPVFEFRGYSMAAGMALIAAGSLAAHPIAGFVVFAVWSARSLIRQRILVSPLRFWQQAQKENI